MERPILFNGEMVQAILEGRKKQTRRIAKNVVCDSKYRAGWKAVRGHTEISIDAPSGMLGEASPLGEPGGRLWVRETWRQFAAGDECGCSEAPCGCPDSGTVLFRADGDDSESPWRPSIHMPRWASRITLEITGVRVERLQEISEEDALAEGVRVNENTPQAVHQFCRLWRDIYGEESWDANPWVWVIEFRRVD